MGVQLVLEKPARLVLTQGREVRPPPGLAPTHRGLPPPPEGLLARLLGLPIPTGTSWRVLESRPTSPWPEEELLGSGAQRLENEVHAASPLHPGRDGDLLDDLGVAGCLSYDDVGPRRQQSPVVTIWGCEHTDQKQFSDRGSHSGLGCRDVQAQGASAWRASGP